MERVDLPVAIIGAGPVGLAAAAYLVERGIPGVLVEAGAQPGAAVLEWGHVRLFSPWRYVVDPAARRLLEADGWTMPELDAYPTGAELVDSYLTPLAELPVIAAMLRTKADVTDVARSGADKLTSHGREDRPYELRIRTAQGDERLLARAVIDASGTWGRPNPLGADGLPAAGEDRAASRIATGIPDVLGAGFERYAGRRVAVVGSGHSAQNVVRDLAVVGRVASATSITWVVRRPELGQMFGGGQDDQLPARGRLGIESRQLVEDGDVALVAGFRIAKLETAADGQVMLVAGDGRAIGPFDEVIAATGFRPDVRMLGELRLDLDPVVESTRALAPLIDPNLHSCGSVPPHGYRELQHVDPDLYVVGAKSYGRAPTFLLPTGYEQVRSVVAALAGDRTAAESVMLDLPATGVCVTGAAGGLGDAKAEPCCGGTTAAPPAASAAEPKTTPVCCGSPSAELQVVSATHVVRRSS